MSISSIQAKPEYKQEAILGECPVWDEHRNFLFWVDILSGHLFQYNPTKKENRIFDIGEHIGSFALREEEGAVLALKTGFAFYSFQTNRLEPVGDPESHLPGHRFNDGKCDPSGRFWAGTLSYKVQENAGSLYTLDSKRNIELKIKNLTVPNGMAWDTERQKFYFTDSSDRTVYAFDFDNKTGEIDNRSILTDFGKSGFFPDGITIDTEGYLWVALYNGYKVVRMNPESGKVVFEVLLPVPQVTSCTFGGADLNELYITTAREHMPEEEIAEAPLSGSLFKAGLPFRGTPPVRFKG